MSTVWSLSLSSIDKLISDLGFKEIAAGYGGYPYYFFVFTDDACNELLVSLKVDQSSVSVASNKGKMSSSATVFTCTLQEMYERPRHAIVEMDFHPIIEKYMETNPSIGNIRNFAEILLENTRYLK